MGKKGDGFQEKSHGGEKKKQGKNTWGRGYLNKRMGWEYTSASWQKKERAK